MQERWSYKMLFKAKEKYGNNWVYGTPIGDYMIVEGAEPNYIVEDGDTCAIAIRPVYAYWMFEKDEIVEIDISTISIVMEGE